MIPFAFILMSHKSEEAYTAIFRYLNDNVMSLQSNYFMSDYERALRNGFKNVSPATQLTACWFHFTQACKAKAYKLGMKSMLDSNKHGRDAYYELLALPLLPADEIMAQFRNIEARVNEHNVPNFKRFLKYYYKQWLVRVSDLFYLS